MGVSHRGDFCVGYFNLRGWKQIAGHIDQWSGDTNGCCRLLIGMQRLPQDVLRKALSLTDGIPGIDNQTALRLKKRLAEEFREQLTIGIPTRDDEQGLRKLAEQIRNKKVVVKLFLKHPLHAKLYLMFRHDPVNPIIGYLGSSNLTLSGLSHQGELNIDVLDQDACRKLARWFEDRWQDRWCIDISEELEQIIQQSWAGERVLSPYEIYLKMAYHLSQEAREGLSEFGIPRDFGNKLFDFQVAAVKIAAHHLNNRGGVIIGDVVGLGKTLMATALARIFQDDHYFSTLILCPKNLVGMWESYTREYGLHALITPFSQAIQRLPDVPARFRLVLIDESHNLRNREGKRYRAIQEYIRQSESRVIMLSATPYNKTYLDLANQLRLFIPEEKDIGLRPERLMRDMGETQFMRRFQCPPRSLTAFEKSEYADDWRDLMRLYLVRRTRSFIKENYAEDDNGRKYLTLETGEKSYFPIREVKTLKFNIADDTPEDPYGRMYATPVVMAINSLNLPRYGLGNYIAPTPDRTPNDAEKAILQDLSRAGKGLMGFCRTNLFKRLESSGHAFIQSIERHILRNFIYLHAIEHDVPIPIGTQDPGILDSRLTDADADAIHASGELFESEETETIKEEELTLRTESDFQVRAAAVYAQYAGQFRRRFRWIRRDLFVETLRKHLRKDALALIGMLQTCGDWHPEHDAKLNLLEKVLIRTHPTEKIIVFTQFADTVAYLERQLKARGIHCLAGVSGDAPDPTLFAYRFSPVSNGKRSQVAPEEELRVLIATDVLSEGQNLQDAAIIDKKAILDRLKQYDFSGLFTQELGWDFPPANQVVALDDWAYDLTAIAEKRGMVVYRCAPDANGHVPPPTTRGKIASETRKITHEHMLIFTNKSGDTQNWQWRDRTGKPIQTAQFDIYPGHSGEALAQRLANLAFTLNEEENLTLLDVIGRVRRSLSVERVTKRFYDRFKKEHTAFLAFIKGIAIQGDREWYASIMLNRLMFLYFIQKKGFLDNDLDYLRNRLHMVQQARGKFLSFYRYFLLRLMHEGLNQLKENRRSDLDAIIGNVPYLNGGIFEAHPLEIAYEAIDIPDEAFENIFDFFDEYQWHLDDRGAFKPDAPLWQALRDNPDGYLYDAVRKGVIENGQILPLPPDIEAGLSDVSKREGWNKPAAPDFALPTETWREYVARRQRCLDIRQKLRDGSVHAIHDFVMLNLDIRQFAQDAVETCGDPDQLWAFYKAISTVRVLDPTCGSGAFLFAALNILEPLYTACLIQMQHFVEDLDRSGKKHSPKKFSHFRDVLAQAEAHANRPYFICKTIILNNLFGVDIMAEATEICKLRLFLKLVAQIDNADHLEPLPDIDFNIRAGNTLVGFATFDDVKRTLETDLVKQLELPRIQERAEIAARAFREFREQQTKHGGAVTAEHKRELRARLTDLETDLNRYLATEYGINPDKQPKKYETWLTTHQPFHWFVDFYAIMQNGGFDVIIGNPPWVEYSKVKKDYTVRDYATEKCGNLHTLCTERCLKIRSDRGIFSFIVQLPLTNSSRMAVARELLNKQSSILLILPFDDRPGKLFEGLQHCRSVIFISFGPQLSETRSLCATKYHRWQSETREFLFGNFDFVQIERSLQGLDAFPKFDGQKTRCIFKIIDNVKQKLGSNLSIKKAQYFIFYQEATQYWIKSLVGLPYYAKNGIVGAPAHGRYLYLQDESACYTVNAILNSSLFYIYFIAFGDCFHLSNTLVTQFPIRDRTINDPKLAELGHSLNTDLQRNAEERTITTKDGSKICYAEFSANKSKPIIDEIDSALAQHYGFTDEELDFIINYDIKYRMGVDGKDEDA